MSRRLTRRQVIAISAAAFMVPMLAGCGADAQRPGLYLTTPGGAPRWIQDTVGAPAWSPTTGSLAWGDEDGLRIWHGQAGEVSRLTPIAMVGRPAWSPDGSAIVFMDAHELALRRLTLSTGTVTLVTSLNQGVDATTRGPIMTRGGPAWSPDGTQVAFVCWDGHGDELCVVDPEGSFPQQVTSLGSSGADRGATARSSVTSMAWSPDGQALAVAVQAEQQGATSGIFLVELGARTGRRLTNMTANAPLIWEFATNDVLFSARVEGRSDVYRLPVDGGKPQSITSAIAEGAREPTADSSGTLAVVSGTRLALLRSGSAEETPVEISGLAAASPALSPDGEHLAFLALARPIEGYP